MKQIYHVAATPEKIIAGLRKLCPPEAYWELPADDEVRFLFFERKNKMYLHPVLRMRNSMRKDLFLTLNAMNDHTVVMLKGRFNAISCWLYGAWFSLVMIFSLMAAVAGEYVLLLPLAAMAAAAIFFMLIMRRFARKEEPEILQAAPGIFQSLENEI